MGIIIYAILVFGSIIFFANAVPALIEAKRNDEYKSYFNKYILLISGFCCFISIVLMIIFGMIVLDQKEQLKDYPKYEQIQEPIYKRIQ